MRKKFFILMSLLCCLVICNGNKSHAEEFSDIHVQTMEEQEKNESDDVMLQNQSDGIISGEVSIQEINESVGSFTAVFSDVQGDSYIKKVMMAIWCDEKGQDDLRWYEAAKNKEGQYSVSDAVSNHKYQLGKYNIAVYVITTDDIEVGIKTISYTIKNSEAVAVVEKNKYDNFKYDIDINGIKVPGGVKNVLIPIWSEVNNQDDLIWYTANRVNDEHYRLTVDIRNHKGLGKYNVHIYGVTNSNELVQLGKTSFVIASPNIGSADVVDKDEEQGKFTVKLSNIENDELIKNIMVPVWSEVNGQDDLVWYTAKKNKETGDYEVKVNIKEHKYSLGKYDIAVYITDVTGRQYGVCGFDTEFQLNKGKISVDKKTDKEYIVSIEGVTVPGGIKNLMVPIWSEVNDQDDLVWYTAKKIGKQQYELNVDISNHKGLGKYLVHAYVVQPNGNMIGVGSENFFVDKPEVGEMTIEKDKSTGKIKVVVPVEKNGNLIKSIQIPIWSDKNQGNIVWYTAKKDEEGNYVVETDISKHKYHSGVYQIHVYMTDITGMREGITGTICDMSPEYDELTVKDKDGTESFYQIDLKNLRVPMGAKKVLFAVWGEKSGQNDIRWYTANKVGENNYSFEVKIRDHKELGKYNVHAYYETAGKDVQVIGGTTFNVVYSTTCAGIQITEVNGNKGTFKVTVSGMMAPSGIQSVQIPMWCSDNQSDIVWYKAVKEKEGVYTAIMDVKNHAYHFGKYKVDVYATMGNGIFSGVCGTTQIINAENYLYSKYVSQTKREILLLGANGEQVQFPTWSDTNNQDDIVWYNGINRGNGTWSVTVDSNNHKHGGKYYTHAYVTKNGVRSAVGSTSYSLERIQTAQQFMNAKANMYSSRTPYLLLVNRSTHKVGIYQGWQGNWRCIQYWDCSDGAPSTPTVEGTFQVGSKGYYFDSGSARCYWYTQFRGNYLFHSVLYNKNGTLMDGRLGMALSHGCVRLDINNAKWIYDTIPTGSTVVVYH